MTSLATVLSQDTERYLAERAATPWAQVVVVGGRQDGKSTLIDRLALRTAHEFGDALRSPLTVEAITFVLTRRRTLGLREIDAHHQTLTTFVAAASRADVAIVVVDARFGLQNEARCASVLCDLLGVCRLIFAINKMDLVGFAAARFDEVVADCRALADRFQIGDIRFVPVSSLLGSNLTQPDAGLAWYSEGTLLAQLDQAPPTGVSLDELRYPVQYVNRPNTQFRGYCGTLAAGRVGVGDEVRVLPADVRSRILRIVTSDGDLDHARAGQAVALTLADEAIAERGDVLVPADSPMSACTAFTVDLVWLHETPLASERDYRFESGGRSVIGRIAHLIHCTDVTTLERLPARTLGLGGVARCQIALAAPLILDDFRVSPDTGHVVVSDPADRALVAAGMVVNTLMAANLVWHETSVDKPRRAGRHRQKPCIVWFTGLSGAGKSTLANALERQLFGMGYSTYLLDGDNVRHGLCRDLGFGDDDRRENVRRIGEAARLMVDAGLITLVSCISPFREDRRAVRESVAAGEFIEVFVSTSLAECERRDTKGLYRRARAGDVGAFTGISSPYEAPQAPDIDIDTADGELADMTARLVAALRDRDVL